jgi:hypothetical protein
MWLAPLSLSSCTIYKRKNNIKSIQNTKNRYHNTTLDVLKVCHTQISQPHVEGLPHINVVNLIILNCCEHSWGKNKHCSGTVSLTYIDITTNSVQGLSTTGASRPSWTTKVYQCKRNTMETRRLFLTFLSSLIWTGRQDQS